MRRILRQGLPCCAVPAAGKYLNRPVAGTQPKAALRSCRAAGRRIGLACIRKGAPAPFLCAAMCVLVSARTRHARLPVTSADYARRLPQA